jgi:arsenate reductase
MAERSRVLFVCTQNSARSQMAEGWLRGLGGGGFEVFSAGLEPGSVRPEAVDAMSEAGIDISGHVGEPLDDYLDHDLDWVITVCDEAAERCPVFPRDTQRLHWSLKDPSLVEGSGRAQAFRRTRDELRVLVEEFLKTADG